MRAPRTLIAAILSASVPATSPAGAEPSDYTVRAGDASTLQQSAPELPDISGYTHQAVLDKRARSTSGSVSLQRMVELAAFDEFVGGDGRLALWAARQRRNPVAIVLRGGYVTPRDIAHALPPEQFRDVGQGVFLARLPILVADSATFHVDEATRALRLSQQAGSFLVNEGRMLVTGSAVIGWDEVAATPAHFESKKRFRPFLVSWGGSETYLSRSRFVSLGYGASKSYGITLSQYSHSLAQDLRRRRPTGWIIDSVFKDLLYGFYCYEADDVVIVRNSYEANIVYGIDPHDRSERLIIAENEAFGTRRRHGIIISREVNNSWIFRNESYDNALSGIMLDRQSMHNVVADNTVHGNGADGITIYESSHNLLYGNRSIGNGAHGFRVRNSVDLKLYENDAIANAYTGVKGHVRRLAHDKRDLQLDPYVREMSMVVVGGKLIHNEGGPIAIAQPLSLELHDVEMFAPANGTGVELSGVLGEHLPEILDLMIRQGKPVRIVPKQGMQAKVEG